MPQPPSRLPPHRARVAHPPTGRQNQTDFKQLPGTCTRVGIEGPDCQRHGDDGLATGGHGRRLGRAWEDEVLDFKGTGYYFCLPDDTGASCKQFRSRAMYGIGEFRCSCVCSPECRKEVECAAEFAASEGMQIGDGVPCWQFTREKQPWWYTTVITTSTTTTFANAILLRPSLFHTSATLLQSSMRAATKSLTRRRRRNTPRCVRAGLACVYLPSIYQLST